MQRLHLQIRSYHGHLDRVCETAGNIYLFTLRANLSKLSKEVKIRDNAISIRQVTGKHNYEKKIAHSSSLSVKNLLEASI